MYCTTKDRDFYSWQRLCVLTSPSNKSFNIINSHHHHRTSSIQLIFLDKFIHLPPYVSLYSEGSTYRLGILIPITLNTTCLFLFSGLLHWIWFKQLAEASIWTKLSPWAWRQYIPKKHFNKSNLYSAITQMTVIWETSSVKAWKPDLHFLKVHGI